MSEQVELRLVELLGRPTESPYGNPIPGLDQLGADSSVDFSQGVIGLVRAIDTYGEPLHGVIRRLAEPVQVDPELLVQLREAGVVPGARGRFQYNEGYVLVEIDDSEEALELPVEVASHIFLVDDFLGGASI